MHLVTDFLSKNSLFFSFSISMCFFLYKTSIFLGTTGDQRNTAKPLEVPLKVFECVSTRLMIMFELLHWWWWWGWVDLKLIGAIKSEQPVLAIKLPEWGGLENHQWLPCQICCFPNVKDLGHVWWQVAVGWRFGWFQTCKMYFLGHFLGCHWMKQCKSVIKQRLSILGNYFFLFSSLHL